MTVSRTKSFLNIPILLPKPTVKKFQYKKAVSQTKPIYLKNSDYVINTVMTTALKNDLES